MKNANILLDFLRWFQFDYKMVGKAVPGSGTSQVKYFIDRFNAMGPLQA